MLVNYAEKFAQLAEFVERDIIEPHGIDGRLRLGVSETIAKEALNKASAKLPIKTKFIKRFA